MTPSVKIETRRGPYIVVYPDGRRVAMEHDVIIVTDIRETILGAIDFGHVRFLPWRYVELNADEGIVVLESRKLSEPQ